MTNHPPVNGCTIAGYHTCDRLPHYHGASEPKRTENGADRDGLRELSRRRARFNPHPFEPGQIRDNAGRPYYLCAACTGTFNATYSDRRPVHTECPHEPDDAGSACRYCGIPAQPADLSPDALALLIQYQATDHVGNRARWTLALTQADINRRRAVTRQQMTADELATAAARFGTVADADALPYNATSREAQAEALAAADPIPWSESAVDPRDYARRAVAIEARDRQREAGDVWRVARHQYDLAREGSLGADTRTNAVYAAYHDAHTERELFAGRTIEGRTWTDLPPVYAAAYGLGECRERLTDPDGYTARCSQPFGIEHSHHDHTARAAVAARLASAQ